MGDVSLLIRIQRFNQCGALNDRRSWICNQNMCVDPSDITFIEIQ